MSDFSAKIHEERHQLTTQLVAKLLGLQVRTFNCLKQADMRTSQSPCCCCLLSVLRAAVLASSLQAGRPSLQTVCTPPDTLSFACTALMSCSLTMRTSA
jgi:hypothetical protein